MRDDEIKYSIEEVVSFCKTYEICIIEREKTMDFIYKTNQSFESVKQEIRQLRVEYACAEPEPDYGENRKGYVYQFKKIVFDQYWAYIKLKIKYKKIIVVLSFHEEEYEYENKRDAN